MDYKKKYFKYKLKYLNAVKMLGGDGRLPNSTLSKDVLEGLKGGMEGMEDITTGMEGNTREHQGTSPGSESEPIQV